MSEPTVPPRATRRRGRRDDDRTLSRIGLWGATSSGKTTMLASLHTALSESDGDGRDWVLFSGNPTTTTFLARARAQLTRGEFPAPTAYEAKELSLRLLRARPAGVLRRLARRPARRIEFELTLMDVSGRMYDPSVFGVDPDRPPSEDLFAGEAEAGDAVERLIDHLARADGMVYLFDPIRELGDRDSYHYLETMLERVLQRADDLGRMPDGKLPHYLAVCITKLDDRRVFHRAYDGGFVSASDDEAMLPLITCEDAADFFQYLCSRETMGRHAGSGPKVRGSIERHFHPGRVRYFASSSIGFYVGRSGMFRIQDFDNVEQVGDQSRIRGDLRPTGVIEPFLWLTESIRSTPPPPAEPDPSDRPRGGGGPPTASNPPTGYRPLPGPELPPPRAEDEAFTSPGYDAPAPWHRDDDRTAEGTDRADGTDRAEGMNSAGGMSSDPAATRGAPGSSRASWLDKFLLGGTPPPEGTRARGIRADEGDEGDEEGE
ncbi:hypothetical protein MXD61_01995 [Frankia sp. AgPm24]|uniref:hypothetical protein n=1 Tax=Frankia sp. AgPm24 TaxID=631128 RepID=UPI00200E6265|nr:hypothetical protein [Frankia sp. AgPm24]MCK9920691.1 hypothetical protein [Frankia sp. AgPm24]